jgi:ABC-type transport system involved in multi-copper enzyme maturation permease subunit
LSGIRIVFQRDFKEIRQTNVFLIITILFALITVAASVVITVALKRQEFPDKETIRRMLELIIGLVAYFLPLSILMTFIWSFANLTIIKEKVSGNIESLLATPLSPGEIWIGKSIAIFMPGYIISIISTFIILMIINFAVVIPATGNFILPASILLVGFLINPLLFLALLLFIVLFSLANNPDIAIAPSFLIGFGLMIGIPLGIATGVINLASWLFAFWCLGGMLLFWLVNIGLYHLLTKENIVLSGKGD